MSNENKKEIQNSAKAMSLKDIVEGKEFFVPLYQRNYKWNKEIAGKLAADLYDCWKKEKSTKSLGLITLYKREDNKGYDLIDGQQRFITLAILLNIINPEKESMNLHFERDPEGEPKREKAIHKKEEKDGTDENRIRRNREEMEKILESKRDWKEKRDERDERDKFYSYIFSSCMMLCNIVSEKPDDEFMNLNAYKTKFSICDHVRANLISLNTFYKDKMEENKSELAKVLGRHSYKTAIAELYNQLLETLYDQENDVEQKKQERYRSVYDLMMDGIESPGFSQETNEERGPEKNRESRINILFYQNKNRNYRKNTTEEIDKDDYRSDGMTEDLDYWHSMILKLACINRMFHELKEEQNVGNYQSFKQIDDFQKLKKKAFLDLIMDIETDRRNKDNKDNKEERQLLGGEISLSELLERRSNVESVLLPELDREDQKLANRYLESYVYVTENQLTETKAELEIYEIHNEEKGDRKDFPRLSEEEIAEEIQGIGRYILDHYLEEKERDSCSRMKIGPILDLEDRENIKFCSSQKSEEKNTMTVKELFQHPIKIPVIQRDYCMGAQLDENISGDFLDYMIHGFEEKKNLTLSTILIAEEEGEEAFPIYVFDGQQRTYTIYQTLKILQEQLKVTEPQLQSYHFIGREKTGRTEHGSLYAKEAVEQLKRVCRSKLEKIGWWDNSEQLKGFMKYIWEDISFTIKITDKVSEAEQFFLDINGGVPLEKCEIFKAILYKRLRDIEDGKSMIDLIENKWLNTFYQWVEKENKNENNNYKKRNDEKDEEELLEMRCIEFLCRYIYKKKHSSDWNNKEMFDFVESKAKLVGELEYLGKMQKEDFDEVKKIMEDIAENLLNESQNSKQYIDEEKYDFQLESKGEKHRRAVLLKLTKLDWIDQPVQIYHGFIWSLRDKNRKKLKIFYAWDNFSEIESLYDEDPFLRYALENCLNQEREYKEKIKVNIKETYMKGNELIMVFYAGYQHYLEKKENNALKKKKIDAIGCISQKEIPAYYYYCYNPFECADDMELKNDANEKDFFERYGMIRIHNLYKMNKQEKGYIAFAFSKVEDKEIKFSNKQYRSYLVSIKSDKTDEFSGKYNEMIKFFDECNKDMVAQNNAYMLNNKEFWRFFKDRPENS